MKTLETSAPFGLNIEEIVWPIPRRSIIFTAQLTILVCFGRLIRQGRDLTQDLLDMTYIFLYFLYIFLIIISYLFCVTNFKFGFSIYIICYNCFHCLVQVIVPFIICYSYLFYSYIISSFVIMH